jgi:hypothetical protein
VASLARTWFDRGERDCSRSRGFPWRGDVVVAAGNGGSDGYRQRHHWLGEVKNTKLFMGLLEIGILVGAFLLLVFTGHYSETMFVGWLGALGVVFGVFVTGNVIASGQASGSTTTTTTPTTTTTVDNPKDGV